MFYIVPNETSNFAVLKSFTKFDYEARSLYRLTLKARNKDYQGNAESETLIVIHVSDTNDNPPEFKKSTHKIEIFENITVGEKIYQVFATDRDSPTNAAIQYSFHKNKDSEQFSIDGSSGVVSVKYPIEKEGKKSYTLFVVAQNEHFKAFTQISISILDVNSNRPYFDPMIYMVNITEKTIVGSVISKLYAYDRDRDQKTDKLSYELIKSSGMAAVISVDRSGIVRTCLKLWEYAGKQLTYTVQAYDDGGLRSSKPAVIIVNVIKSLQAAYFADLRFQKEIYHFVVKENVAIGSLISRLEAYFPSSTTYVLKYICLKSNDSGNFTVSESTGDLYTRSVLDYEAVQTYSLKVFACDIEGRTACAVTKVLITIEDVNDNLPIFAQLFYNVTIALNTSLGSSILQVKATDYDSGNFGVVLFEIVKSNESSSPFAIGKKDGVINLVKELNATMKYILVISAFNKGMATDTQQCLVQITIFDQSGGTSMLSAVPVFAKDLYQIDLSEDSNIGQRLVNVTASLSEDRNLTYALYGNFHETFKLDAVLGFIYLSRKLDFEVKKKYDLFLVAEVDDIVTLRSCASILVRITDVNDNRPIFVNSNQLMYFHQGMRPGSLVTKVIAYDLDSGVYGQVAYRSNSSRHFTIDSSSGELRIKHVEAGESYSLSLDACDMGIPALCSTSNVTVHISRTPNSAERLKSDLITSNNSTSIELQFDIDGYLPDLSENVALRFIAQEIHESPECKLHHLYLCLLYSSLICNSSPGFVGCTFKN